jgi:hypothetical protein
VGGFYWGGEKSRSALVAHLDAVAGLCEARALRPNPMSDESGVVFRFLPRRANMTQHIPCASSPTKSKKNLFIIAC